jgi:hypothetical protein
LGERSVTSLKTGSARSVVLVLVLVAGQDTIDAVPGHLQIGMLGQVELAGVAEGGSKCLGQPNALAELAYGEQAAISGELARRWLDHQRCGEDG